MDVMKSIAQEYMKSDIPAFGVGDTVKVHIKIKEGNRERIQIFEGFVLKKQNGGVEKDCHNHLCSKLVSLSVFSFGAVFCVLLKGQFLSSSSSL